MRAPLSSVVRFVSLGLSLGVGCRPGEPPLVNPGVSTAKSDCTLLPHGCAPEGCPDLVIPLGEGCGVSQKGLSDLDHAAHELLDTPLLTKLVVVAPTLACANLVRAAFESRGVQPGRIQVAEEENRSFVTFQVEAWNEKDCRTGAPSKLPVVMEGK